MSKQKTSSQDKSHDFLKGICDDMRAETQRANTDKAKRVIKRLPDGQILYEYEKTANNNTMDLSIEYCRYYKGEYSINNSQFWNIERVWVKAYRADDTRSMVDWYNTLRVHGLLKWSDLYPKIPTTLKGLILDRFLHNITYNGDEVIQEFKEYFKKEYLKLK